MQRKNIAALLLKCLTLFKAMLYKGRLFNFIKVIFFYLFNQAESKGLPSFVQIEPTNRCNLKCSLCITGRGDIKRNKGDMSFQVFKKTIDELEKHIFYLGLYNLGEPLLNKEIYKMIEYAKEKGIFIRLSTNGFFYDRDNIRNLVNSGLDELVISLDYATPQTYMKYTGMDGFKVVVENIRSLIEARGSRLKPFIALQLLVMRETEEDIPKFKRMVCDLAVDRGVLKPVRVNFPGFPPMRDILPKNSKYIRKAYLNTNSKNGVCYRPWISTVILWDETVVPCCFDMWGGYSFGNLSKTKFGKIWNSENYISFRRRVSSKFNQNQLCKECSLKDIFHDLRLYR